MITVYTVAYNEDAFIQFMIDHYRSRFPGCEIVVHDNESTDATVEIAMDNGAEVRSFNTNNQFSDSKHLEIKNNCWKNDKTDWVLVCDMDELLDINEKDLKYEESLGYTLIRGEGWNMIDLNDEPIEEIVYGSRCEPYDKIYLFNKKFISEINYSPGCHQCKPEGYINRCNKQYMLYHYKCIGKDYMKQRYATFASRLSEENKKYGYGDHYIKWSPEFIENNYDNFRKGVTKLR